MKKKAYETTTIGKYKNCLVMENGNLKIAVSTEFGPRVMGCFIGGDDDNMFVVLPNRQMKGVNNGFRLYGGHRLWHSPEAKPRSYQPDNDPVIITEVPDGFEFACQNPEAETGIRKSMLIEKLPNDVFSVTHSLENCGQWNVELAPWALTMFAPGGTAIIPQNRDITRDPFTPDRSLVLWPYSSLSDPRLTFGTENIFLKQDSTAENPIKIGYDDTLGWIGYVRNGKALIKYFEYDEEAEYPDRGCSIESYSCAEFQEVETLAPLQILEPGETVEYTEYWQGLTDVPEIKTDADVAENLDPRLLMVDACDDDEDDCCDCGCEEHHHHG